MRDLLGDRDDSDDELEEEGASILGGGGPASTLGDDEAELDEADYHGDRLAGGDPEHRED